MLPHRELIEGLKYSSNRWRGQEDYTDYTATVTSGRRTYANFSSELIYKRLKATSPIASMRLSLSLLPHIIALLRRSKDNGLIAIRILAPTSQATLQNKSQEICRSVARRPPRNTTAGLWLVKPHRPSLRNLTMYAIYRYKPEVNTTRHTSVGMQSLA